MPRLLRGLNRGYTLRVGLQRALCWVVVGTRAEALGYIFFVDG